MMCKCTDGLLSEPSWAVWDV